MNIKNVIHNTSIGLKRAEFWIKQFLKESWPLRWDIWKQPNVLFYALRISPYPLKVVFTASSIVFFLSAFMTTYGFYLVLTTDAATSGGFVQEAILGSDIKTFNPVLEPNSLSETKINSLLYHPLYRVNYPDFLTDTVTEPQIIPVLLEKPPEWVDSPDALPENRFKNLRFTLRKDVFWSNNTEITIKDVLYTFDRLKEERGNSQFRSIFNGVNAIAVPGTDNQFDLISDRPNPQLIYASNFYPISSEYYGSQISDRLLSDPKSFKPVVTSGYFTFTEGPISDPDNPRGDLVENPIRDRTTSDIKTIVLSRNPNQNAENVFIDQYIIRRADALQSSGGENDNSLEKLVQDGKVDLFTRFLGSNLNFSSDAVRERIKLNQKIVPTNTYYNLYLNIQINEYFINKSLRNYVMCHFLNFPLNQSYSTQLESIPPDRRIVPLQLGASAQPECLNPDALLDPKVYSMEIDERTNIKRLLLLGKPIAPIELVGFEESNPLLTDVQIYFRDIGIPAEVISDDRVASSINERSYNAIFAPITIASRDPYGLLGVGGRNISNIRENNRIEEYKVEENLFNYSLSNLTDQNAKNNLINFFANEFVAVNLFRANMEINYSDRLKPFIDESQNDMYINTFSVEIYNSLPLWFVETRRTWRS